MSVPFLKPFMDAGPSLSHIANTHDARVFLNSRVAHHRPQACVTVSNPLFNNPTNTFSSDPRVLQITAKLILVTELEVPTFGN